MAEAQATIHQLPGGQQRGRALLQGRMLLYLSQPLRLYSLCIPTRLFSLPAQGLSVPSFKIHLESPKNAPSPNPLHEVPTQAPKDLQSPSECPHRTR